MKKTTLVLLTGLGFTSFNTAVVMADPTAPSVDSSTIVNDDDGSYSATINNASVARAIHPLKIVAGQQLTFPDLVVSDSAIFADHPYVTVSGTSTSVMTQYSSAAASPASSLTSGVNASGEGLVAKLGSVKIYGHENMAIAVTVTSAGEADLNQNGYSFSIPSITGEAGHYTLGNTDGNAEVGQKYAEITFGGTFRAMNTVETGAYLYDKVKVTVNYRGG